MEKLRCDLVEKKYIEWASLNDMLPLFKNYEKLSTFIKSIQRHTEMEDLQDYRILRAEINELSHRTNLIINQMRFFEKRNKDYRLYKEMFENEKNKEG